MKLSIIFAQFTLIVIVKGAWWAAAVHPVVLGFGAVMSAINLDVLNLQSIELKNLLPFVNKQEESKAPATDEA